MNNIFRHFFHLLLFLSWLAPPISGQGLPTVTPGEVGLSEERLGRIGTVIQKYVDQNNIAGAVTMVARRGKVAHLEAFGMMDREASKPMRTDAIFRIASMTKPITSVAIMMLYEEGYILLNDPVSKYIPEFKNPRILIPSSSEDSTSAPFTIIPANREMKILHLLNHTSGITYGKGLHAELYKKAGISHGVRQTEGTIGQMVKKLASIPLLHHPGEAFEYGLSTDVLGYLVEVVSGQQLDDFFRERIFNPLSMKDTHFFLPQDKLSRLAAAYMPGKEGGIKRLPEDTVEVANFVISESYPYKGPRSYFSGGGGLCSTISDYARFSQMLLNGGELDGVRLLSRKTVELMTFNTIGDLSANELWDKFGLGLGIYTERGYRKEIGSFGTYGWSGGFSTFFWIDPEEEMINILMTQLFPPFNQTISEKFRVLAYQAISD